MKSLPQINARYWASLIMARILGTLAGDCMAFGTALMPPGAAVVYAVAVAGMLYIGRGGRWLMPVYHWATLSMIRCLGTDIGDALAHDVFGLAVSTLVTGGIFVAMIAAFYGPKRLSLPAPDLTHELKTKKGGVLPPFPVVSAPAKGLTAASYFTISKAS